MATEHATEETVQEVETKITEYAIEYMASVRDNFQSYGWDVTNIEYLDDLYQWQMTVDTGGEITSSDSDQQLSIELELVFSEDFGDIHEGFAIQSTAVWYGGEIITKTTPKNFTEDVWTSDIEEIQSRITELPEITPEDVL